MQQKTPQEISDYKYRWMSTGGYKVTTHSDLEYDCRDWCNRNLLPEVWRVYKHTNVYEHTFYFEKEQDAREFASQWNNAQFVE